MWTIRPDRGWRSRRWITPPLYVNRQISAADRDGAADWAMDTLDLPGFPAQNEPRQGGY